MSLTLTGTGAQTGHPEACPDINAIGCAERSVPPEWHDLLLFFGELRLHAAYGVTDWLALDLGWSLRVVSVKFTLEDLATRQPIAPPFGGEIHHRTETLVGLTDPWLSVRVARRLGPWRVAFRAGATFPVGNSVPNPFELGRAGVAHEHIQFGTGTVDPLVEVEVRRAIGRFTVAGSLLGKAALYQNRFGYQAGGQLLGGLRALSDLWTRRFSFALGAAVYHEQPERWAGIEETEGNLGRTDVLLDTSVGVALSRRVTLSLDARFPVYTVAKGEQLSTPALLELSVARPFDL